VLLASTLGTAEARAAALVDLYDGDSEYETLGQETLRLRKAMEGHDFTVRLKHDSLPTKANFFHYLIQLGKEGSDDVCKTDSDCDKGEWRDGGLDLKANACRAKLAAGEKCGKAGALGNDHKCQSGECSVFPKYVCKQAWSGPGAAVLEPPMTHRDGCGVAP
jgi:hypothetical protein